MRFRLYILILSVLFSYTLSSQEVNEVGILYHYERSLGVIAHSDGFGFSFRRGKNITGYKKRLLEIEFVTMKHPKEQKIYHPIYENSKGYIYGKFNSLFIPRIGAGRQHTLTSKWEQRTVEVRSIYSAGASIGLVKPVYLEIIDSAEGSKVYCSIEKYDTSKHDPDKIYGRASFLKGIDETKLWPGIYGKIGLGFEWSIKPDAVYFLETGIILDVFYKQVPIMAYKKNKFLFLSFYINLSIFGKKWY